MKELSRQYKTLAGVVANIVFGAIGCPGVSESSTTPLIIPAVSEMYSHLYGCTHNRKIRPLERGLNFTCFTLAYLTGALIRENMEKIM